MRVKPGSLVVFAPVCKSYSSMRLGTMKTQSFLFTQMSWYGNGTMQVLVRKRVRSRYTSGRCIFIPYGNEGLDFVAVGNCLGLRTILLCIVASFLGLRWLLEQPSRSTMEELPEFQYLLKVVQAVWINLWFKCLFFWIWFWICEIIANIR